MPTNFTNPDNITQMVTPNNLPAPDVQQQAGPQMMGAMPQPGMGNVMPMPGMEQQIPQQATPLDVLLNFAQPQRNSKSEISLKTLKKKEIDRIMESYIRGRDDANNYYTSVIEPKIIERENSYYAREEHFKKLFPKLSETSNFCSRDILTAINWMLPNISEPFTGTESAVDVKGVNTDDDVAAEKIQQLLTYELQRKNEYPVFINYVLKDALAINYGVAKVYWKREEDREPYQILVGQDDLQMLTIINQESAAGHIEITDVKPLKDAPDLTVVSFDKITLKANYPVVERMSPSELRYSSDSKTLNEAKFKAQRKIVTGDYLKRKEREGIYENVDEAMKSQGDAKYANYDLRKNDQLNTARNRLSDGDNASKLFELYEAYLSVDYNNDGIYEHVIVHAIGNTPIRIVANEMEQSPFFVAQSDPSPNTVFNKDESFSDLLDQLQNLKTALLRQIITNVAKNNGPRTFLDPSKVDMDAVVANDEIIPTEGNPADSVMTAPQLPLSPLSMTLVEYAQNDIEAQSGSTRYNQGLDSNSLNKMLDIHTPVPMHDGSYKELGDIQDGDVIIGQNGKPTTVLKAHFIHYPERAYLMKFASGEEIKAGGEHLWTVTWAKGHPRRNAQRHTVNTDELVRQMKSGRRIWIDRVERPEFNGAKELPLDPYFFGLWLGDGCVHTNRITTEDDEIRDYVKKWAEDHGGTIAESSYQNSGRAITYDIKGTGLRQTLKAMNCVRDSRYEETKDCVKHIPEIYFRGSYADRLALLQGLMDTDGCHHSGALCIFSQKEGQLLDDVERLIESLGGFPTKHQVDPGHCGKSDVAYYNIHFSLLDCPFRLNRKKKEWKTPKHGYMRQEILSITEIEPIPMRCLTVSAKDGQFCVGRRFTVTHNTATGVSSIMEASAKRMRYTAMLLSERFIRPIFKYLIELNQKYMDDEQIFRLTDQNISIRKEELNIDYDLIVNVGQGVGTKTAMIQYMTIIMSQVFPQLQNAGVVTEKSWYMAGKKLMEAMGVRNIGAYLLDPDSKEAQARKQQAAQEAMQAQQAALAAQQAQMQAEINKAAQPRISISYADIPPAGKMQVLKKYMGVDVNTSDIMQEERLDDARYVSRWGREAAIDTGANTVTAKESASGSGGVQGKSTTSAKSGTDIG